ncbi:type IV pilus modification PilV family protein [Sulfitobacter sabulilitoris]|uniref:Prepilin-type N-terminal cleavage/methylation domain-containing protein n=1 Tax=Sulfitobacter sabulilitoris TaxID=2562655 RepID=A0A5S3PCI4_9RHOB|nr:type II secretion system protein [Sulfitobacter sabulilitoris]TMM51307.1 prepilin-type N-terminal cleavage/methylation domain-containing protein [Sulfitobacter sabulilitoris]
MRRGIVRGDGTAGLTLLELVVAIAVLSIGTLAALRAMDQSRLVLGGATPRLMAQLVAQNRAEELRLFGPAAGGLPDRVVMGLQSYRVTHLRRDTAAGLVEVQIVVRADTGPGATLVTVLPPQGSGR